MAVENPLFAGLKESRETCRRLLYELVAMNFEMRDAIAKSRELVETSREAILKCDAILGCAASRASQFEMASRLSDALPERDGP